MREALEKGLDAMKLQENWDYLQINCAMYINSDMPGVASQAQPNTKPLRCKFTRMPAVIGRRAGLPFACLSQSDEISTLCHSSSACSTASVLSWDTSGQGREHFNLPLVIILG